MIKMKTSIIMLIFVLVLSSCSSKIENNKTTSINTNSKISQTTQLVTPTKTITETPVKTPKPALLDYSKFDFKQKVKTYTNTQFKFSVDYPHNWNATTASNGGININPQNNEYVVINIVGIDKKPAITSFDEESQFSSKSGIEGVLCSSKTSNNVEFNLYLNSKGPNKYYIASSLVVKLFFEEYQNEIYGILRSIKDVN